MPTEAIVAHFFFSPHKMPPLQLTGGTTDVVFVVGANEKQSKIMRTSAK